MRASARSAPETIPELRMAASGAPDETIALVAAVIDRGRPTRRAWLAAQRLVGALGGAAGLSAASVEEIRRSGRVSVGQAEALRAAFVLARQLASAPLARGERFSSSRDLFGRYRARFLGASREFFLSLHLNAKNQLIREVVVSVGSLSSSVVHPREVFSPAVRDSSAGLIFLHNHPSGDPAPSREDRDCTSRLGRAGKILGIRVLDHVILGSDDYFSFADSGLLEP